MTSAVVEYKPGSYIVTKDGLRGYVVERKEGTNMYQIRLTSGYVLKHEHDIEIDKIMQDMFD